jgi:hypothetical protein
MDKLRSLHKLLLECFEDDEIVAKAQLTFIVFHLEKAIKEQSAKEFQE